MSDLHPHTIRWVRSVSNLTSHPFSESFQQFLTFVWWTHCFLRIFLAFIWIAQREKLEMRYRETKTCFQGPQAGMELGATTIKTEPCTWGGHSTDNATCNPWWTHCFPQFQFVALLLLPPGSCSYQMTHTSAGVRSDGLHYSTLPGSIPAPTPPPLMDHVTLDVTKLYSLIVHLIQNVAESLLVERQCKCHRLLL